MTQIEVTTHLNYINGNLYWVRPTSNRVKVGDLAGSIQPNGYRGMRIHGKYYGIHVLTYIYHYGAIPKNSFIDHKDRNKLNNDISNLRCVSKQENTFNLSNTKGYVMHKNKYVARITLNGIQYQIGTYLSAAEATEAYNLIKPKVHVYLQQHPTEKEIKEFILKIRPTCQLNNTSGYSGVHKRPNGTYQARCRTNGKYISLGHFSTPEEAHNAILLNKNK